MAFKIGSREVITNSKELKGKRLSGRLGKTTQSSTSPYNLIEFDTSSGDHFVLDYNKIINRSGFVKGTSIGITFVARGINNAVPGDKEKFAGDIDASNVGISDGWEATVLIKNLWPPSEVYPGDVSEIYGAFCNVRFVNSLPRVNASLADYVRIGLSGDELGMEEMRCRHGSSMIFKFMKPPNRWPGYTDTVVGSWNQQWLAFPMMRNLF